MKNFLILVGIIVIAAAGFSLFTLSQKKTSDKAAKTEQAGAIMEGDAQDSMMNRSARYVQYSPETLVQSANNRRVLYFYANWCPTCRPADNNFRENESKIPADVTLIRVNYNDTDTDEAEKALAQKYGITYQHTFVQIDSQGNEIIKWNGGQIDELNSNLK